MRTMWKKSRRFSRWRTSKVDIIPSFPVLSSHPARPLVTPPPLYRKSRPYLLDTMFPTRFSTLPIFTQQFSAIVVNSVRKKLHFAADEERDVLHPDESG